MQTSKENRTQDSKQKFSTHLYPLLEIQKEFSVPVEKLFQAFTHSDALKIWWWPKSIYADKIDLDFCKGGRYFINMKGFEDGSGGMTGEFKEIVENECIVMSDQFANDQGEPITAQEAGVEGNWPEMVYIAFDFSNLGENRSSLSLSQDGIPTEQQKDCKQGWSEMFDKLDVYLNKSHS